MSPIDSISHPRRHKALLVTGALGVAGTLAFAGPIAAAMAAGGTGSPTVATSKTVKANLKADGTVDVARLFTQIQATGNGNVKVTDPTSTDGLRNLNGFGGPSTDNGKATYDFSVNGTKNIRTVANLDKDKALPVDVKVSYTLDGKAIHAGDVAGKSGKLAVSYDIKNTTGTPTDITYPDGLGKTINETVDIVTPYVGQLQLQLPKSYDKIASNGNRADQAGDGHGGKLVTWTMVLFAPIGQTEQKFGFTADVDNAVLPEAHVQIVPVSPANHPELKFGQDGFANGAQTGRDLTSGADQIDKNVLKLRDGAGQLLDGLTQLQNGAVQLSTGLADGVPAAIDGGRQLADGADKAADGAGQLADGASQVEVGNRQLAQGLVQLAGGAGQLAAGSHKLRDGVNQLALGFSNPASDKDLTDGSQALASAMGLISGGLGQLNSASTGLPAAKAGALVLQAGVDRILAGIGTPTSNGTILFGLDQLTKGNAQLVSGVTDLQAGAKALADGLPLATGGIAQLRQQLVNSLLPVAPGPTQIAAIATALGAAQATAGDCIGDCPGQLADASTALTTLVAVLSGQVGGATNALDLITAGLDDAIAGVGDPTQPATIQGGLALVAGGLAQSAGGLAQVTGGVNQVKAGLKSGSAASPGVSEGLAQLVAGLTTAVSGIGQLAPGAAQANAGAGDLADGIGTAAVGVSQLKTGATQLSDGLDQVGAKVPGAVSGAKKLAKGSHDLAQGNKQLADALQGQLAPGARKLANGLGDLNAATDGAQQIATGLGDARDGGKQIFDGTGRLSKEGTSQLVKAGDDTSKEFGRQYAIMQVLNKKGADNALPIGTPTGSNDNRGAYDITIAGVGHQGTGNAGRGVAGIAILAIGAAAATALRGRFA